MVPLIEIYTPLYDFPFRGIQAVATFCSAAAPLTFKVSRFLNKRDWQMVFRWCRILWLYCFRIFFTCPRCLDNWPHVLKTMSFFQANVRPPHSFQIPDGWGSDCICRGTGDSRTPDGGNLQTGLSMEAPGSFFISGITILSMLAMRPWTYQFRLCFRLLKKKRKWSIFRLTIKSSSPTFCQFTWRTTSFPVSSKTMM